MASGGGSRTCRAPTGPMSEPRAGRYRPMRCRRASVGSLPRTIASTSAPGPASSSDGPPQRSKPGRPEKTGDPAGMPLCPPVPAGCGAGQLEVPGHLAGRGGRPPALLVGDRVVPAAQQCPVEQAGFPAVDPVDDVMGVCPLWGRGTADDGATLV